MQSGLEAIAQRQLEHFMKLDPARRAGVAKALGTKPKTLAMA